MKTAGIFALFVFLAILVTYPLIFNLNRLILDLQDGLLITWILNWTIAHPFDFNANIFYPLKNTLAFSETMFPLAFMTAPAVKLFNTPLLAYNFSLLLALILTPFSIYLLTKSIPAALVFTYSPIFFGYLAHIQVLNFWPVILAIYFLLNKRYWLFALFIPIAATTSVLFLYFLLLVTVIQFILIKNIKIIVYYALGGLLSLPFLLPYFAVSRTFNYVRPITDAIHNSVAPIDLITQFFPGWAFIAIASFWLVQNRFKIKYDLFSLTGISALILSFGPALHIFKNTIHLGPIPFIPLPYALLYYLLPGFAGLRTPSRWILLAFFCFMVHLFSKIKLTKKLLVLLAILVLLGLRVPIKYYEVPAIPKTNYANVSVIYFPIYGWWDYPGVLEETKRMYFSIGTWQPMFNGYSGFSPKEWEEKVKYLQKIHPEPGVELYEKYF